MAKLRINKIIMITFYISLLAIHFPLGDNIVQVLSN